MSEPFVASNGVSIAVDAKDVISWSAEHGSGGTIGNPGQGLLSKGMVCTALREFFLHEAGLWRDEETGAIVIRLPKRDDADGPAVTILLDGELSPLMWGDMPDRARVAPWHGILPRYFAACPEPKPWYDAKPNEVWVLAVDGEEYAWSIDSGWPYRFVYCGGTSNIPKDHPSITAGRRIWPEVDG